MKNNFPKLLIEINNFELIFVVIETNENDHFSLLYSKKYLIKDLVKKELIILIYS